MVPGVIARLLLAAGAGVTVIVEARAHGYECLQAPQPAQAQPAEAAAAPPLAPPPRLPEDAAKTVTDLEQRIKALEQAGLTAGTREEQDAALEQAIALAEEALAIREEHQGRGSPAGRARAGATGGAGDQRRARGEWYEVADARRRVEDLRLYRGFTPEQRRQVREGVEAIAQGEEAYGRADYREAESLMARALETRRQLFPADHPAVAEALNNLAVVRDSTDGAAEAEPLYIQALEMRRRLFPGDHPEVAQSLNNLAFLRDLQGRAPEAEPLLVEALQMRRRLAAGDDAEVVIGLNSLAAVRHALGRASEAEPLLVEAMGLCRRLFPGDSPYVAMTLNNLAGARRTLGRPAEAEALFVLSLEMRRRLHPGDHPDIAGTLENLAIVRRSLGRADEAEPLLVEALEMRRRVFGGDHADTAMALNNLGYVRESLGRAPEAEPLYLRALEMQRRLFPGDHPHPEVAVSLSNLGHVRASLGRAAEAEASCVAALEMQRRLFRGDHEEVATGLANLARVRRLLGRAGEAAPLYDEALAMVERMRTGVLGGAGERAAYAEQLNLASIASEQARTLLALGRPAEALTVLERGRGRAALDLVGPDPDPGARVAALGDRAAAGRSRAAAALEASARSALLDAENLVRALGRQRDAVGASGLPEDERARRAGEIDRRIADGLDVVAARRRELSDATVAVFAELRGLIPAANPLTSEQVLGALAPVEAVVAYTWARDGVAVLVARGRKVIGMTLADDEDAAGRLAVRAGAVRRAVEARPEGLGRSVEPSVLDAAREALLPAQVREAIAGAAFLTIVPDGPLHGIPLELLVEDAQVAYAPSATIAVGRRSDAAASATGPGGAVVLGDPDFGAGSRPEPDYPEAGVLLTMVQDGGNGAVAGLRRGDVIVAYNGRPLRTADELKPAVDGAQTEWGARPEASERPITATVWRASEGGGGGGGVSVEVKLAVGRLGVGVDPRAPGEGLRSMAILDRSAGLQAAGANALEQVRLHGGTLRALPGSRTEVSAVGAMLGSGATVLLGTDASAPRLRGAVFASPPRVLHLATHGFTGSAARPLDASLALAQPAEASLEDIGFLTLGEVMGRWLGRLRGTELVVLSACDTARGVSKGDTTMALPMGFLVSGAETVIASLWKVDDTATALLMSRFYSNYLGAHQDGREIDGRSYAPGAAMPKLAALREARAWLRSLTVSERDRLFKATPGQIAEAATRGEPIPRRGTPGAPAPAAGGRSAKPRPYDHPYYWSAFVLYGSPE